MENIVIIGGEGNGTVIASTIRDCQDAGQKINCAGFLCDDDKDSVNEYTILGKVNREDWKRLPDDYHFVYALSTVKRAFERYHLLQDLSIPSFRFASPIIHPSAVVSSEAKLSAGVVVMPFANVGPDAVILSHSLLLAQSFVGHNAELGEMVFVANNATIGGNVFIGNGVHIGSNSSILEHVTVGEFSVVGLGAVVLNDVYKHSTVVGNPARTLKGRKKNG